VSTTHVISHSPKSISSTEANDTPVSTNPFEKSNNQESSTNPFELSYNQAHDSTNPFESATRSEAVPQHSNNPFEMREDDGKSVKSLDDSSSRRQSWVSNRLGLSTTINTDGSQQEDTASQKSRKKRHTFNVFKKLTKGKSKTEDQERKQEERTEQMLLRKSSTRRNALHGPF
jgi:hypothetical protein